MLPYGAQKPGDQRYVGMGGSVRVGCELVVASSELVVSESRRMNISMGLRPEHGLVVDRIELHPAMAGISELGYQVVHPFVLIDDRSRGVWIQDERSRLARQRWHAGPPPVVGGVVAS